MHGRNRPHQREVGPATMTEIAKPATGATVLVTGVSGFLGGHIATRILAAGYRGPRDGARPLPRGDARYARHRHRRGPLRETRDRHGGPQRGRGMRRRRPRLHLRHPHRLALPCGRAPERRGGHPSSPGGQLARPRGGAPGPRSPGHADLLGSQPPTAGPAVRRTRRRTEPTSPTGGPPPTTGRKPLQSRPRGFSQNRTARSSPSPSRALSSARSCTRGSDPRSDCSLRSCPADSGHPPFRLLHCGCARRRRGPPASHDSSRGRDLSVDTTEARSLLGWEPRPVSATLHDTGRSLINSGIVQP